MSGPRPGALSAVPRFARDDIEARLCAWWTASFDRLRMPSTASGCLRQAQDAFDSLRMPSTGSGCLRQARLRRPRGDVGHRGEGLPGRRDNGRPRQEPARRDRSSLGRTTGTVGRRLNGEGGKRKAADFRKQKGPFITARREPKVVRLPALKYVMIAGRGDPAKGKEFQEAVQALYTLVYTLKFSSKPGSRQRQRPVLPLEGR